ncbi:MAG: hypothetical protein WDM90_07430 [Ferruginibacter sp.]
MYVSHPAFTAGAGVDSSWKIISSPAGVSYTATQQDPSTTKFTFNITQATAVSIIYKLTNTSCPTEASADTLSVAFIGDNQSVTAGQPQQLCAVSSFPITATLSGSASTLPVLWTNYISTNGQPGTIASPNSTSTTVSLPATGMYKFLYQITSPLDAACPNLGYGYTQITTSAPGSTAFAAAILIFVMQAVLLTWQQQH